MRLQLEKIPGAYLIIPDRRCDERGWFARECEDMYATQVASAFNPKKGTWRGLHYQDGTDGQTKWVRCVRGSILDFIIDVRKGTPNFLARFGIRLDPETGYSLLVPPGVAHGYLTLEEDTEVLYIMTGEHRPEAERGVRFDDPSLNIQLPFPPQVISQRDDSWPDITLFSGKLP